jgi:hypothetical protein
MMIRHTRLLLFLGAGASCEFGVPGMKARTSGFLKEHSKFQTMVKGITRRLRGAGFPNNLETVLWYSVGKIDPKNAILQGSPYLSDLLPSGLPPRDRSYRALINEIEEYIAARCTIHEEYRVLQISECYSGFFSHLIKAFTLKNTGSKKHPCLDIDVFTTNYDNLIEQFCESNGHSFYQGYQPLADHTLRYDTEYYEQHSPIRLYKLHGSVTIGMLSDGRPFYSLGGLKIGHQHPTGGRIIKRAIIFAHEMYPPKAPYSDLLCILKLKLLSTEYALIVGYSFPNPAVLNLFLDAMRENEFLRLIVLDPKARVIVRKKLRSISRSRIAPVQGYFRDYIRIRVQES